MADGDNTKKLYVLFEKMKTIDTKLNDSDSSNTDWIDGGERIGRLFNEMRNYEDDIRNNPKAARYFKKGYNVYKSYDLEDANEVYNEVYANDDDDDGEGNDED
jgi:hypothetical protein